MRALAIFLYLWLAVSLSVYGYRLWRRITHGSKAQREAAAADADAAGPSVSSPPQPRRLPPPDTSRTTPSPTSPPTPPAPDRATPRPAVAPTGQAGRAGLFSKQPEPALESTAEPETGPRRRPPVADALSGITMPCGLSPYVESGQMTPFRAVFWTTEATAAEVGAALGDDLERLGYELHSSSATRVVGRREGVELTTSLDTEAGAWPGLPDGAVVAIFET